MCDLYSYTKGPQAIRELMHGMQDHTGNLPPRPSIFPDDLAPVVRCTPDGGRELLMMRWGIPSPPQAKSKITTNVRNVASNWWMPWLGEGHRCLVAVTSFCEYDRRGGKPVPTWFALDESRPLFFFAGIWRPFFGERKCESGEHLVFAFLTTRPGHEKSMPVVLDSAEAREAWMKGSAKEALHLQRRAPGEPLRVIASGQEQDGV